MENSAPRTVNGAGCPTSSRTTRRCTAVLVERYRGIAWRMRLLVLAEDINQHQRLCELHRQLIAASLTVDAIGRRRVAHLITRRRCSQSGSPTSLAVRAVGVHILIRSDQTIAAAPVVLPAFHRHCHVICLGEQHECSAKAHSSSHPAPRPCSTLTSIPTVLVLPKCHWAGISQTGREAVESLARIANHANHCTHSSVSGGARISSYLHWSQRGPSPASSFRTVV
jgi:hypothetical protein